MTPSPKVFTQPRSFGINLIGHFTANVGLGVTTRAIAHLLKSKDIPFSIYGVSQNSGSLEYDP